MMLWSFFFVNIELNFIVVGLSSLMGTTPRWRLATIFPGAHPSLPAKGSLEYFELVELYCSWSWFKSSS